MNRNQVLALLVLPLAVISGFMYVAFAYSSVRGILLPDPNVGFGPHRMSSSLATFLMLRAAAGVVSIVSALMMLRRRYRWSFALLFSLVVINAYNAYNIWLFMPDARMANASVLEFFPLVMRVEYMLHFLALVTTFFVLGSAKRSGRDEKGPEGTKPT
jgi:hypothetical protein